MCVCFVVPSAPEMFMVVDVQDQQVNLTWKPPSITNGIITGYVLEYFRIDDLILRSKNFTADERMFRVESLNEFTQYQFQIRAFTSAGLGELASLNVTTAEAGILINV